jgi:preprotein translocase subunit SecD
MFKSVRGRLALILAIAAISGYQLYSNGIKLGLDLQGGMHLVLEVDDPDNTLTADAKADAIDRVERVIRTRVDEFGVEEPLIQKVGSDRLIVELAGIGDEERAKEILQQSAFLEWKLVLPVTDLDPALPRLDRAVVAALGEDALREMGRDTRAPTSTIEDLLFGDSAAAGADSAAADSADAGEAETGDAAAGEEQLAEGEVDQDTPPDLRPLTGVLNRGEGDGEYLVAEEDVETLTEFLALDRVRQALPRNVSLQWGWQPVGRGARAYRILYVLEEDAFLTGDMLENAVANRDPQFNQAIVQFELNRRGGRRFADITAQHVGDRIAIVLDGEVVSAPVVRDRIGARGQIELGQADLEEARDLALVLRAGALPAPLTILEERTVGPSLGQDSIDQGKLAGIIGLVLVVIIMIAYYRTAGMLAVLALMFYVLLVLGGLAGIGATLTLPGIAGIILSVGMAVDANVLIFERIREELVAGRATRTAVDEGFANALSAIVDANLTTLITALILFQFGTGPIRGFAVTLSIGIVASFFSALYVTRTFFLMYLSGKKASDPISI